MTSERDYLGFGSPFSRMLQELKVFKGPRVPSSIQSMWHYYRTQDPTLMRITFYHGSQEFSDLGLTMSPVLPVLAGSCWSGLVMLVWPGLVM